MDFVQESCKSAHFSQDPPKECIFYKIPINILQEKQYLKKLAKNELFARLLQDLARFCVKIASDCKISKGSCKSCQNLARKVISFN